MNESTTISSYEAVPPGVGCGRDRIDSGRVSIPPSDSIRNERTSITETQTNTHKGPVVSEKPGLQAGLGVYPANCRVTDGARTRDLRDHNPMLCQLSYGHQATLKFYQ